MTLREDESYTAATEVASTALTLPLPEQLFRDMPVDHLVIEHLLVDLPSLQEYRQFRGQLKFTGQQFTMQLQSPDLASVELSLLADRDNTLIAELTVDGSTVLNLDSRVTLQPLPGKASSKVSSARSLAERLPPDRSLSGKLEINLARASELLGQLSVIPPGYFLGGKLFANWTTPLPETLDSASLEKLQLVGNLGGAGDFRLPQQAHGGSSHVWGNYKLQASYEATGQGLTVITDDAAITAQVTLPAEIAAFNLGFGDKPLALALNLKPGARLFYKAGGTTISVEDLAGELQANHSDAGLDALLSFNSAVLERSTNVGTPGSAASQGSNSATPGGTSSVKSNAEFTLKGFMGSITTTDFSAKKLRFESAGSVLLNANKFTLATSSPTVFSAQNIRSGGGGDGDDQITLPTVKMSVQAPISLTVKDGTIEMPSAQLLVTNQQINMPDLDIHFSQARVTLNNLSLNSQQDASLAIDPKLAELQSAGSKSGDIKIDLTDLEISPQGLKLAPTRINAQLKLRNDQVSGHFSTKVGDELLTSQGELQHNLRTGRGKLKTRAQSSSFTEQRAFLPRLFIPLERKPAKLALDLSAGQINVDTLLEWNAQGLDKTTADISLLNVSGFYQRNFIKNMNAKLFIQDFHNQWNITADSIHIAELDIGVPITNIQFEINVQPPIATMRGFEAELLGGIASQKTIVYDWTRPENKLLINLQNIQLAQVLELVSDISGSGNLDGAVPIEFSSEGIRIAKGHISNRAPGGIIKYSAGMAAGNSAVDAGLQLTLDALKNFHYSFLGAKIDSDEKGNIALKTTLKGHNPDLKDQPPIHFNLNITENIPDLLKSLKLAQDISDDLNKRIEYFYKPGTQGMLQ